MPVYGFGEKKTPQPFVDACSPFIFTENLVSDSKDDKKGNTKALPKKDAKALRRNTALVRLLRTAVEQAASEDGWAHMSKVGSYISNSNSSFSSINYGYKKLGDLIRAIDLFDIEMRNNGSVMHIKDKRK